MFFAFRFQPDVETDLSKTHQAKLQFDDTKPMDHNGSLSSLVWLLFGVIFTVLRISPFEVLSI
jgi:hypothetical protein